MLNSTGPVAAFSSMIYDYMLTFDLEVKFIWSAPWGVVKILYLLTRYILFFNITFATAAQLASAESSPECKALHQANIVFAVSGMIASESLLTIRTWAVCGNRRWLGIVLSFCFSAFFCALVVTNAAVLSTFKFLMQDSPLRGLLHECLVTRQDAHLSVILGCLVLVYDAVNMGIIIMPAYYAIKQGSSNLVLVVLRDGLIYYVYIFIMSAASIAVFTKLTGHHTTLVTAFGHTLHAIFTCRVVLHAREEAWKTRMISAITLEHIDLEASK
ncbi:hypothetical protein BDQ17DRAFT_914230 [Cyathus striatus]|nr:hypothetical protein BDQ17DRAFT_914230 [Cyathus striatus]